MKINRLIILTAVIIYLFVLSDLLYSGIRVNIPAKRTFAAPSVIDNSLLYQRNIKYPLNPYIHKLWMNNPPLICPNPDTAKHPKFTTQDSLTFIQIKNFLLKKYFIKYSAQFRSKNDDK